MWWLEFGRRSNIFLSVHWIFGHSNWFKLTESDHIIIYCGIHKPQTRRYQNHIQFVCVLPLDRIELCVHCWNFCWFIGEICPLTKIQHIFFFCLFTCSVNNAKHQQRFIPNFLSTLTLTTITTARLRRRGHWRRRRRRQWWYWIKIVLYNSTKIYNSIIVM